MNSLLLLFLVIVWSWLNPRIDPQINFQFFPCEMWKMVCLKTCSKTPGLRWAAPHQKQDVRLVVISAVAVFMTCTAAAPAFSSVSFFLYELQWMTVNKICSQKGLESRCLPIFILWWIVSTAKSIDTLMFSTEVSRTVSAGRKRVDRHTVNWT